MANWQDWALSAGVLVFAVALIPSVRSKDKPALGTSVLTAFVLAVTIIVYASLHLWFSVVAAGINFALWLTLAIQKYRQLKSTPVKAI